jgi:hypothetical protein
MSGVARAFDPFIESDPNILHDALLWAVLTYALFLERKGDVVFDAIPESSEIQWDMLRRSRLGLAPKE